MDLRQLRYFVEVASCSSVTDAASRLNLAQSALSRHIHNLELDLGCRLFERSTKGVSLTVKGAELLPGARDLLASASGLRARISHKIKPSEDIYLGAAPSLAVKIFTPMVQANGNIDRPKLHIQDGYSRPLHSALKSGIIDLAILTCPDYSESLQMDYLTTEAIYLVSAPPLRHLGNVCSLAELTDLPLVLTSRGQIERDTTEDFAKQCGVTLKPLVEADTLWITLDLVRRGACYAMLPYCAVHDLVEKQEVQVSLIKGMTAPRYIAYSRDRTLTDGMISVIEMTRHEMRSAELAGIVR